MQRDADPSNRPESSLGTGEPDQDQFVREGQSRPGRGMEVVPMDPAFDLDDAFMSEGEPESEIAVAAPSRGTVVDMEMRSSVPSSAPGVALSVSELLESQVAVDWHEAVAITRRICEAIPRHPSAAAHEYLLDPHHIEITERGEVRVLPGGPGGDPYVKQVGRILRALLENGSAPASLRLLASQAAFEIPGFGTVQELSDALRTFDAPVEREAIQTAFQRGREARFSSPAVAPELPAPPPRPLALAEPTPRAWGDLLAKAPAPSTKNPILKTGISLAVVGLVAIELTRRFLSPVAEPVLDKPATATEPTAPATAAPVTGESKSSAPVSIAPAPVATPEPRRPATAPRPASRQAQEPVRLAAPAPASADPPLVQTEVETFESLRRRFDGLVLANPEYRLDPGEATPQRIIALRDSKRLLLPAIAGRDLELAQSALDDGDVESAIQNGERALRLLADPDLGSVPGALNDSVRRLLAEAHAAKAREDDRIYTTGDAEVVPPTPLSRQLPVNAPLGLSRQLVGQLEMVVGVNGEVEIVRLHTPLNRYHERMIVSAAKAWRYQPATKDGRPVRFRLFTSVNLPED